METEIVEMRCARCGYGWKSKAKLIKVSCPNCGYKNRNPKPKVSGGLP